MNPTLIVSNNVVTLQESTITKTNLQKFEAGLSKLNITQVIEAPMRGFYEIHFVDKPNSVAVLNAWLLAQNSGSGGQLLMKGK